MNDRAGHPGSGSGASHRTRRGPLRAGARPVATAGVVLMLAGCGGSSGPEDLEEFVRRVDEQPTGIIEPLPEFLPYEAFAYGAGSKRSPFEPPAQVDPIRPGNVPRSNVRPDPDRVRQYLERFDLGQLSMVGTLSQDGIQFALILDAEGGVHPVRSGDYMGRNHGRITQVEDAALRIVEIVSDGAGGWLERNRTVQLTGEG